MPTIYWDIPKCLKYFCFSLLIPKETNYKFTGGALHNNYAQFLHLIINKWVWLMGVVCVPLFQVRQEIQHAQTHTFHRRLALKDLSLLVPIFFTSVFLVVSHTCFRLNSAECLLLHIKWQHQLVLFQYTVPAIGNECSQHLG